MLTQETKRKIDSARQILVGKVPDPKEQVEQITTALIYKFMDDMDKEAQELGGRARFFTNGYEKYAWTKLMDAKLGGHERLDLYLEAITSLSRNPHIPQLFRDIFKDAFLPYRSPETLSMFLKEINGFIYEYSEDLGDAFEYLLSILGSQGDAGQFRTPRHIIDFIVAAVDPKKDETICDPACGTAGFLISAFKHILKENKERPLTPDERKNLMDHFVGYDISPDMVRISKVNLYLHGFPNPTIFEYDTLSSEEKWDDNFDVMLANPPFMSPKGGIRPHKRFSVQANRSEVLFVDYILEHLRPNGRAGIIVPEGIIFQSATAYKALRKLLIEDGLLAVVSLPAGVFNPYAGVKTSILLFDNGLAKTAQDILFLKISNDGYDLGAQRREIDKNDLPQALEIIKKYKAALKENQNFKLDEKQSKIAHLVAKEKIAESGDYNLSGDRYKEVVNFANKKWPMVRLDEICKVSSGDSAPQNDEAFKQGQIPFVRMKDLGRYHLTDNLIQTDDKLNINFIKQKNLTLWPKGSILIPKSGSVYLNHRAILGVDAVVVGHIAILSNFSECVLNKYLYYVLRNVDIGKMASRTSGLDAISLTLLKQIKIPLPSLEVQKEIVEQIEVKQKAIEAAKAVIENLEKERCYFGQSLRPACRSLGAGRKIKDVEWVELGEVCEFKSGLWKGKKEPMQRAKIVRNTNFAKFGRLDLSDVAEHPVETKQLKERRLEFGDIILENSGGGPTQPVGRVVFFNIKNNDIYSFSNFTSRIRVKDDRIDKKFLYLYLDSFYLQGKTEMMQKRTSGIRNLDKKVYQAIKIPLPPLNVQKQLVAEMEEQEKIIEANKKLIGIMEQKITEVLNEI